MAEASDSSSPKQTDKLDLSSLNALSLGPDWGSGLLPKPRPSDYEEREPRRERGRGGPRGDRPRRDGGFGGSRREGGETRPPRRFSGEGGERPPAEGDRRGGGRRALERVEEAPFRPVVEVDFYPEEEPFRLLTQAIKSSYRTFELFEIARLILEKPERFVCVLKDPQQKEGQPALLSACVIDGLPFKTEGAALNHCFQHYLGEFFDTETVEGEAPSGVFPMVHKCGITGEVIAPPNYHRYKALCREHHAAKLAHMDYARFEQKLESSREEADIQIWQEKMKTKIRYTLKEEPDRQFDTLEDARLYLLSHCKEKLVRPAYSARFSGKVLSLLPSEDAIRRSVEFLLEEQRRFPLVTANHLRGRLRRMNFAVYKRGSKGISFVCAVKRRFRKPDEVLADSLQELIDFLEAHPNFAAKDLPKGYLGIDVNPPAEGSEASADISSVLRQLKTDLRYLVSEGYLIEFSDGRLLVPPQQEADSGTKKRVNKPIKDTPAPAAAADSEPEAAPQAVDSPEHEVEVGSEPELESVVTPQPEPQSDPQVEPEPESVVTPQPEPETRPELPPETDKLTT